MEKTSSPGDRGQLHVVLNRECIEKIADEDVLYWDPVERQMQVIGVRVWDLLRLHGVTVGHAPSFDRVFMELDIERAVSVMTSPDVAARFVQELFRGKLMQCMHINSNGGCVNFMKFTQAYNRVQVAKGADVIGFLSRNVSSAALGIASSIPILYASSWTEFLWHIARYKERATSPYSLDLARILDAELREGEEDAIVFEDWLRRTVDASKFPTVLQKFQSGKSGIDHEFRFDGFDAIEWGLVQKLDASNRPSDVFGKTTGISVDALGMDNTVRTFLEDFDGWVEYKSCIKPLF